MAIKPLEPRWKSDVKNLRAMLILYQKSREHVNQNGISIFLSRCEQLGASMSIPIKNSDPLNLSIMICLFAIMACPASESSHIFSRISLSSSYSQHSCKTFTPMPGTFSRSLQPKLKIRGWHFISSLEQYLRQSVEKLAQFLMYLRVFIFHFGWTVILSPGTYAQMFQMSCLASKFFNARCEAYRRDCSMTLQLYQKQSVLLTCQQPRYLPASKFFKKQSLSRKSSIASSLTASTSSISPFSKARLTFLLNVFYASSRRQ